MSKPAVDAEGDLKQQLALREVFETQIAPRIEALLVDGVEAAARKAGEGHGLIAITGVIDDQAPAWEKLLFDHFRVVSNAFGSRTFDLFEEAKKEFDALDVQPGDVETGYARWSALLDALYGFAGEEFWLARKDALSVFQLARDYFIHARVGDKVKNILDTTKERIKAAVLQGVSRQEGQRQIAARILEHVDGIGNMTAKARSQTIARTETHQAANYGNDEAARATGIKYDREWLSVEDARTRPHHAAAHGQIRGPDEPFNVGGYSMDRPGEGPAAEVINCRCTLRMIPRPFKLKPGWSRGPDGRVTRTKCEAV